MSLLSVTGKSEIKEFHRKGDIYQTARLSHNYQELVLAGAGDGRTVRQTDRQTDRQSANTTVVPRLILSQGGGPWFTVS